MRTGKLTVESPLTECAFSGRYLGQNRSVGVVFEELPFQLHVNLRCEPSDELTQNLVARVLGVALPTEPNVFFKTHDLRVFWLAPDEWLVVAPPTEDDLVKELDSALDGMHHAVTELTGGQTIIRISGPAARELLAQGCTIDLHPTVFGMNCCAQTLLAHVPVLLCQVPGRTTEELRFDVVVRRSFADYLSRWLIDGAVENGFECRFSTAITSGKSDLWTEENGG